ncbi:MAG: hypothetical protein EP330_28355 [Deltaproteobacteria bacterium]|nr:MAG: hypothetical protein EP330_28355 [Deltaproteobacteria bacterium]
MRTLFVFAAAVVFPSVALAWEDTVEDVTLTSSTELYRGVEYTFWLPSEDSTLSVQLRADTQGDLDTIHKVDSTLAYDGEGLTHWFSGVVEGGTQNLSQNTNLSATIHVDLFGMTFTNQVWSESFAWKGESVFDTALIPQGWATSTVRAVADSLITVDTSFDVSEDIQLTFLGEIVPTSQVVLSGDHLAINGKATSELDWAMDMPLPVVNPGTMDMNANWTGKADATFGIDLLPTIGVCFTDFGCFESTFAYSWVMASETAEVVTHTTDFDHHMPAVAMMDPTLNFGEVLLGESKTLELSFDNHGLVDLEGEALIEGDGFTLDNIEVLAAGGDSGVLLVTFTPEEEGTVTGGVTFFTNDPLNPEIFVPVSGTGLEPIVVDPTDGNDGVGDEGGDPSDPNLRTGCACNATPAGPQGALGGLGLVAMLLLRRRRS